jgi:hypothetical protein
MESNVIYSLTSTKKHLIPFWLRAVCHWFLFKVKHLTHSSLKVIFRKISNIYLLVEFDGFYSFYIAYNQKFHLL